MTTDTRTGLPTLYERDFVAWVDETVEQLRRRDLASLDWEHIIEEIEGLGSSERHRVDSYLIQLLVHLLLYRYWNTERERCARGWEEEITNFRVELEVAFESKTLYNYFLQRIEIMYPKAVKKVTKKTLLPASTFPESCPFTVEQLLNDDFFPIA
jgi:hypothetical protein